MDMKALYAGDAAILPGPIFVSSPFNVEVKGCTTKIWNQPLMVGGWSSLCGRFAHGGYYNTPVEEALPVTSLPGIDDRVETPEGSRVNARKPGHPVLKGIPWGECPGFEGFNRILTRKQAEVLATIGTGADEHPLVVVWQFVKGRALAFASDCSPHWAAHFQPWAHYRTFWQQALRRLGARG